jgi:hypothetical protein
MPKTTHILDVPLPLGSTGITATIKTVLGPLAARARWEKDMTWVFNEPYLVGQQETVCPVWGDEIPYKSVTVIVAADEEDAATYCLACAHGGDYDRRKVLDDGRIALRSNYQAW